MLIPLSCVSVKAVQLTLLAYPKTREAHTIFTVIIIKLLLN